jgi:hypothetical protein
MLIVLMVGVIMLSATIKHFMLAVIMLSNAMNSLMLTVLILSDDYTDGCNMTVSICGLPLMVTVIQSDVYSGWRHKGPYADCNYSE